MKDVRNQLCHGSKNVSPDELEQKYEQTIEILKIIPDVERIENKYKIKTPDLEELMEKKQNF